MRPTVAYRYASRTRRLQKGLKNYNVPLACSFARSLAHENDRHKGEEAGTCFVRSFPKTRNGTWIKVGKRVKRAREVAFLSSSLVLSFSSRFADVGALHANRRKIPYAIFPVPVFDVLRTHTSQRAATWREGTNPLVPHVIKSF